MTEKAMDSMATLERKDTHYKFRGTGRIKDFEFTIDHNPRPNLPSVIRIYRSFAGSSETIHLEADDIALFIRALQDIQDFAEDHDVTSFKRRKDGEDSI